MDIDIDMDMVDFEKLGNRRSEVVLYSLVGHQ